MACAERTIPALVCILLLAGAPARLPAVELWADDAGLRRLSLNPTLKLSGFAARNPDDRAIYPASSSELALCRLRLDLNGDPGPALHAQCAYEHSGRFAGGDDLGAAGTGILPSASDAPYRVRQLYDDYVDDERAFCAHELDRALVAWHPDWGDIVAGRQAIGLGRGRLFSAVDLFAPFAPLEIDREWRRGVDAVRAEYRISATAAAEAIAVFGEHTDESAFFARVRGYWGDVDAEILGGRRYRDEFLGLVASSAVFDAEVHGECALFRMPRAHPEGQPFGDDRTVLKAVLGSSYTFGLGNGLTVVGEYHYSGFGADDSSGITALYALPEYEARYLRGDMQIMGRHAVGLQASCPVNESVSTGATAFVSPDDGSGILSPSLRWDFSETGSFTVAAHVPWGEGPQEGVVRSEYGSSPTSLFVQLGFYM